MRIIKAIHASKSRAVSGRACLPVCLPALFQAALFCATALDYVNNVDPAILTKEGAVNIPSPGVCVYTWRAYHRCGIGHGSFKTRGRGNSGNLEAAAQSTDVEDEPVSW